MLVTVVKVVLYVLFSVQMVQLQMLQQIFQMPAFIILQVSYYILMLQIHKLAI